MNAAPQKTELGQTDLGQFERHRRRLFGLAYRMLGSVAAAEDAVQDTYLRWHRTWGENQAEELRNAEAWLVTACTRLCVDRLRAAKAERILYTGEWLPEPLAEPLAESLATPESTPDFAVELADSLQIAFLLVLEKLRPAERAAYLLRHAFDYDYAEIAAILGKSEAACRQLLSRAQRHLQAAKPQFDIAPRSERHRAQASLLVRRFMQAASAGDPAAFAGLLLQDAEIHSDGGGKVAAARNVIRGAERCMRFFIGITRKQPPGLRLLECLINGQPGFVTHLDGQPVSAVSLALREGAIQTIYIIRNPDKLRHLMPLLDAIRH